MKCPNAHEEFLKASKESFQKHKGPLDPDSFELGFMAAWNIQQKEIDSIRSVLMKEFVELKDHILGLNKRLENDS